MRKNILYELGRVLLKGYAGLLFKLDVHWHDRKLPDGPKLFVANHPSATDPFMLHLLERMSVLISGNAFSFPVLGRLIRETGQIPVERGQGVRALDDARRLLEAGHSVGIFPEGTFSPRSGGLQEPRTGAARLAIHTGVPVIPIGIYLPIERSHKIVSRLSGTPTIGYWYFRGPYVITVGKPLEFQGDPEDKLHVRSASQNIMEWIRALAAESERRLYALAPSKFAI